ncbi:hypothetical protein FACS1894164_08610 [Spirochaetia bacterium]|nr:hypothetical protein FACS1894164_08610 [Spirochaetia bacterium]
MKRIPIMEFDYFNEMYTVFTRLAPRLGKKAKIIIDIGDSIFAGVHIPTDDILIELFNENYLFLEKKKSENGAQEIKHYYTKRFWYFKHVTIGVFLRNRQTITEKNHGMISSVNYRIRIFLS